MIQFTSTFDVVMVGTAPVAAVLVETRTVKLFGFTVFTTTRFIERV